MVKHMMEDGPEELIKGVLLFNPRATEFNPRMPNSVLQIAAAINPTYDWIIVDGNLEVDSQKKIGELLSKGNIQILACTVMPGPQLKQVIPICKQIRTLFPAIRIVWGGYFASNHMEICLKSGFVDFIVNGPGDIAFPLLLQALNNHSAFDQIQNLAYLDSGKLVRTAKSDLPDLDKLPGLPYLELNKFYDLNRVLPKTWLGKKTLAAHTSFGCPFTCSFCAVVPIYNARWKGKSAVGIVKDIMPLLENFKVDSIEFHDNNFFVSEKRTIEFSELMLEKGIVWWGEGRIDTLSKYSDSTLRLMRQSGCKMIFFGAETGNDEILKEMDKGGTQTGKQILEFAERLSRFDIIPEYSFVLGTPAKTEKEVLNRINQDIEFIKKVKERNPATEIIIYLYSPVPAEGSEMFEKVKMSGFKFPEKLEDWISPSWEKFDLRKNPLTPWLKPSMVDLIRNFETVLNAQYPTVTDIHLRPWQRLVLKYLSNWRYKFGFYRYPKELGFLFRIWKYRQPEKEGF